MKTLRVKQWTKNLLLFAGALFARQILIPSQITKVIWAFCAFCLVSSALYIFNDLLDIEKDRNHPRKRYRPIASGAVSKSLALALMFSLAIAGMAITVRLSVYFQIMALSYIVSTLAYTIYLKRIVIVDVMTIAAGFVLRAVAGAVVIKVPISPWLLVCTLLLALFLGLTKRRQELVVSSGAATSRKVLDAYSVAFLDQAITVVTAATLTGYFFYTFSAHSQWLMVTIPFVIYGIFRYLLLAHSRGLGEEPEQILISDWPFILNIILWLITSGIIIYLV